MSGATRISTLHFLSDAGIEYVAATSDAMYKKLFVQSSNEKTSEYRRLLIEAVSTVVGYLDKDKEYSILSSGTKLADRTTEEEKLLEESINSQIVVVPGTTRKVTKRTKEQTDKETKRAISATQYPNLSENLKVDCASCIKLDNAEEVVFDIEMQVSKNQKPLMGSRLPHYGEYLTQLKFSGDNAKHYARKAFSTALCMWDCDDANKFGVVWGTPRECFINTESNQGVVYPSVKFPVCCAQIFLGETVRALEVIRTKLGLERHLIDDVRGCKSVLNEVCESRSAELESKFQQLWGEDISINKLRSELMRGGKDDGYEESDFKNEEDALEKFKIVEYFELMQLIATSNAMSTEKVQQICSKKVRSMYEDLKISEENIMNDVLLEKERGWLQSIQAAQTEEAIKEAAGQILGYLGKEAVGIKSRRIDKIISDTKSKFPDVDLDRSRVIKQVKVWRNDLIDGEHGGLKIKHS